MPKAKPLRRLTRNQYEILRLLADCGGMPAAAVLVELPAVSRPSVYLALKTLVAAQLVETALVLCGTRPCYCYRATEAGRRALHLEPAFRPQLQQQKGEHA